MVALIWVLVADGRLCSHSKVVSLIMRRADGMPVVIIKEGVRASGLDDARCLADGRSLVQERAAAVRGTGAERSARPVSKCRDCCRSRCCKSRFLQSQR